MSAFDVELLTMSLNSLLSKGYFQNVALFLIFAIAFFKADSTVQLLHET